VITAVHTLVYADDADAARAFFRDVLGWPHVDAHGGWLIFKTGPSELGVHPTTGEPGSDDWTTTQRHQVTLLCDDVEATVAELTAKGAHFTGGIQDEGFGLTTMLQVPGAGEMMIYQPHHPPAYDL
jgi:catechol 2,3-dioxygenase-like lactoylglutathione lyase family enzyme